MIAGFFLGVVATLLGLWALGAIRAEVQVKLDRDEYKAGGTE